MANGNILSGLGVGRRNRRPRRVVGCGREAVTLKLGAVFSTKQAVWAAGWGKTVGRGRGLEAKYSSGASLRAESFHFKAAVLGGVRREL